MKTKLFYALFMLYIGNAFAQFPFNGLIGQYGFDNGSLLVDGANGNNFSQTGTSLVEISDRFNGTPTSAIDINTDHLTRTNINYPNDTFGYGNTGTISFWIKTSTNSADIKTIIDDTNGRSNQGDTTWAGYYVYLRDGKVGVSLRVQYNGFLSYRGGGKLATKVISDGNWHHIAVRVSSSRRFVGGCTTLITSSAGIYVDGVDYGTGGSQEGSCSSISLTQHHDTNGNIVIGNNRSGNLPAANRYEDEIDDILFYDRVLTAAEVQSIIDYNDFCFAPESSTMTTSNITDSTVDIAIPNTTTYDIAYHKTSEPFSNATTISSIASGSTNVTGLDPLTEYNIYVREHCTMTTTSAWSAPITFETLRPASITRLYVDKDATGLANGFTWVDAYTSLNDALQNAYANDEIWIAEGTYNPDSSDRSVYFNIDKADLKIYGGFAGTETQLSDRIFGTNETILSGDLQNNDANVSDFASNYANTTRNADNSYHIINILTGGDNLLLDRLTISDAHNNLSGTERGGAIIKHKSISKLTLQQCIIKDNVSRNDNAGIVAEFELNNTSGTRGQLTIDSCQFINNMSRWATAIYSFIRSNTRVDISVSNSLFTENVAGNLSSTVKGLSGSAAWLRNIGNSNSQLDIKFINNTLVNNLDTGTDQSLNNFTRATLAISKNTTAAGLTEALVANTIFWENYTLNGVSARSITDLYKNPANTLEVVNSIDKFNFSDSSISSASNNSTQDPLFTNLSGKDYTLQMGSPAIDAGDNTKVTGTRDLIDNARIANSTVDMGAYEFGSTPTLSIDDVFEDDVVLLTVYPNPVIDFVTIESKQPIYSVTLTDVTGLSTELEVIDYKVDLSNLPSGIYFLQVAFENGTTDIRKILKK